MLPNISLDTEKYKEILDGARNMIVSLYPEWTDFNYHDPGITMLELFSWIKESQQYYIDQIGEENRKKYLKLMGIEPQTKVPAEAELGIIARQDLDVLPGTKFYAGEICFEAEERSHILKSDISCCLSYEEGQPRITKQWQLSLGNKMRIYPFGREPKAGSCFYLGFEEALPSNTVFRALLEISDDYKVKRNPVIDPEAFYPLAEIIVEAFTKEGWREVKLIADETHAFLFSGRISISVDAAMELCELEGLEGYFLRFRLGGCDYDIPPLLQAIRFNTLAVRQRDTLSEVIDFASADDDRYCVATELSISGVSQLYSKVEGAYQLLPAVIKSIDYQNNAAVFEIDSLEISGEAEGFRLVNTSNLFANNNLAGYGTGLPFQEIDLNDKNIEYDSLEIMTEDSEALNRYYSWVKVKDFSASSPEDRHYIFDSAKGLIKFGDCIKGMAPEGNILIIGYALTWGSAGNVKQSSINRVGQVNIPEVKISNQSNAGGGLDEETLEDAFKRLRRMLKRPRSAISYDDYENYVLTTPGLMIESCRVIPAHIIRRQGNAIMDMTISIVVKPFYPEQAEAISPAYSRNIMNHLDKVRLLGTNIQLLAPEYIGVTVYADISVKPHYTDAPELVENAVRSFFFRYKEQFGVELIYSELYGVLDRLACVSYVSSLSLEAKGNGITYTKEGNIIMPANGVVLLSDTQFMFSVDNE